MSIAVNPMTPPVLELSGVGMVFTSASRDPAPIFDNIDVCAREGEIVGLLGRSGSGKSTLLRIAAGLIKPTTGSVGYKGCPLHEPAPGIAMVFQTFALYPWLSVLENVELGLDALSLRPDETRRRATDAIDLIGLDGFQSALPRELSGGMRQRVGFARAIASAPTLLLLDEPFSALDVLTAETLRTDFLDLWTAKRLPTKAVVLVTHNIEEAVLLCDRILVLGSKPGRIEAEIAVDLPQPRNRLDDAFRAVVDEIYSVLTSRMTEAVDARKKTRGAFAHPLPDVTANEMVGFIEKLIALSENGRMQVAQIAQAANLKVDDLLHVTAALGILEIAEIVENELRLTAAGRIFAEGSAEQRKHLFREHLIRFAPLAAHIRHVLDERSDHVAPEERFLLELQDHLPQGEAEATLKVCIDWGRYAELFSYDARSRIFSLQPVGRERHVADAS